MYDSQKNLKTPTHKPYVLLAESHPTYQKALSKGLQRLGFEVIIANDGHDALSLYEASPDLWCVILIAYQMPVMNGYTSSISIRQFEKKKNLPSTPIIGISENYNIALKQKAVQSGMNSFFPKPQTLEKISEIMKPYISQVKSKNNTQKKAGHNIT